MPIVQKDGELYLQNGTKLIDGADLSLYAEHRYGYVTYVNGELITINNGRRKVLAQMNRPSRVKIWSGKGGVFALVWNNDAELHNRWFYAISIKGRKQCKTLSFVPESQIQFWSDGVVAKTMTSQNILSVHLKTGISVVRNRRNRNYFDYEGRDDVYEVVKFGNYEIIPNPTYRHLTYIKLGDEVWSVRDRVLHKITDIHFDEIGQLVMTDASDTYTYGYGRVKGSGISSVERDVKSARAI